MKASGLFPRVVLAALTFFLILTAGSLAASAKQTMKLKVAGVFPPPEVFSSSAALKAWQDEVTERTSGRITFENFWGSALGAPAEHLDLVKSGAVQVAQFTEWYQPGRLVFGDFEYVFPFGPTDYGIVAKATRQIRSEFPEFEKDYTRENVILIADPPTATYNFLSRTPLQTIADFEGKRVSLIGRYFGKWLPPGASAVVRPAGERYDLMRAGVVDVDFMPFEAQFAYKLHEVAKYFVRAQLTTCAGTAIFMNLDTFKQMSPEDQQIVLEAGKNAELKMAYKLLPELWGKVEAAWKAAGVEIITLPEDERNKWADSVIDTPAEWAAEVESKGYPGFRLVERWQAITSEMGHDWPRKWGIKR